MNLEQIRQDTPGCKNVIHFNNAGAALMPLQVMNRIREYQDHEFLNGGYETASAYTEKLERTYTSIGLLVKSDPEEIALLENATAAWDMAFHSISFKEGDTILTSFAEYSSNYLGFLQAREKHGVRIKVIRNDQFGQLDLEDLELSLKNGAKLVAINHIPTNSGLVNPAEEIGHLTRKYGTLFLLDACQSVGQYPLDVTKINCDILSATGRKFLRGPRGTGFLFVKRDLIRNLAPPFLDLHSASWNAPEEYTIRADARRFENWESNYALRMGLQEAADYAMEIGLENIQNRVSWLASELRSQLREIPGVSVHDRGRELCGIVTLSLERVSSERVKEHLRQQGINVSITDRTGALLDMMDKGLDSAIRASVHYYNTIDEINTFIVHIKTLLP